ncbi:glycosyltransferase, partial [Niveibacterium sp.]|uniref:glycosyltransferase n=1 Tax=Niveibacterium sp. TaxID=2017444 RepID=UPI0035AD79AF
MRVLHILDHSIPLHSGYTFRTAAILREQRRLGWETFHVTSPKQGACAALEETVDGLQFFRTPLPTAAWSGKPLLGELELMRQLERRIDELIVQIKPQVLHAHSPVLNAIPAIRAGRRHGLPVVYEVRAFWE